MSSLVLAMALINRYGAVPSMVESSVKSSVNNGYKTQIRLIMALNQVARPIIVFEYVSRHVPNFNRQLFKLYLDISTKYIQ